MEISREELLKQIVNYVHTHHFLEPIYKEIDDIECQYGNDEEGAYHYIQEHQFLYIRNKSRDLGYTFGDKEIGDAMIDRETNSFINTLNKMQSAGLDKSYVADDDLPF